MHNLRGGLEIPQRYQKGIHSTYRIHKSCILLPAIVEETMVGPFISYQLTAIAFFTHLFGEQFRGLIGYDRISCTVKDYARYRARYYMVIRRHRFQRRVTPPFCPIFPTLFAVRKRPWNIRHDQAWIEKHQRIGLWTHRKIIIEVTVQFRGDLAC